MLVEWGFILFSFFVNIAVIKAFFNVFFFFGLWWHTQYTVLLRFHKPLHVSDRVPRLFPSGTIASRPYNASEPLIVPPILQPTRVACDI